MADTARGMIINMLHQLQTFGFIPNGGRLYYLNRSQPPTLSETLVVYLQQHFDLALLRECRGIPARDVCLGPYLAMISASYVTAAAC